MPEARQVRSQVKVSVMAIKTLLGIMLGLQTEGKKEKKLNYGLKIITAVLHSYCVPPNKVQMPNIVPNVHTSYTDMHASKNPVQIAPCQSGHCPLVVNQ